MKRIVAFIVCLCLMLSTSGCLFITIPSIEIPKLPIFPTKPQQTGSIPFTYTLTDEDVDAFYRLLEASEKLALESADFEEVDQLTDALDEQYNVLEDQCAIAQLLYYSDMSDEAASELYLECVDICGDANNAYMEMVRRIYQSDAPTKDQLFEDWTQQELDMLMAYTDEIMTLQKRNSELLVEYQSLPDTTSDAMIPLYIEQVRNHNRMAQIYGFENYYEYAFRLGYERDYGVEELEKMRGYVAKHLAPIYKNAYNTFSDSLDEMSDKDRNAVARFMSDHYMLQDEAYLRNYLKTLPEDMKEIMQEALDESNSCFTDSPDAYEGAFTTQIGERSFCFFGPGYSNSLTVAHELGHFYGSYYSDLDALPLDLAETQSQGNEWLFMGQLAQKMDPQVYAAMCNYKLFNDLATLQICVLVDEFEQRIYAEPNLDRFTAADFNRVMTEVCSHYGGEEYISYWLTDIQSYWRDVVMESPVYYISYAVSAVAAMNLYTLYLQDPEQAVQTYRLLIENEAEAGFLQTIEAAGLPGPFDESFYADVAKMYSENC